METYWSVMVFVFGAIIGSFLNVVIYRMHTGRSLDGRSHCMSYGKTLRWYELFPVLSYLAQWGACRGCRAYIPSRYLIVEVLTGALFVLVWHLFGQNNVLFWFNLLLVSLCVVIVVYDMRHTIIPDELTIGLLIAVLAFVGYEYYHLKDAWLILSRIGAGVGASTFFGGLWYVSKGRWIGFGDAKLAFPLAVLVGGAGVFSMIVLSFWIGALVSLALLGLERLLKRGKVYLRFLSSPLTITSEAPFAPFLILGFLLVHFFHANIFDITYVLFFSW